MQQGGPAGEGEVEEWVTDSWDMQPESTQGCGILHLNMLFTGLKSNNDSVLFFIMLALPCTNMHNPASVLVPSPISAHAYRKIIKGEGVSQRERETERERDRQTDRQRQRERQTETETERQRQRQREKG